MKKLDLKNDKIENYHIHSHKLGIVPKDLNKLKNKLFGIECNFEELNGIDFKKGCYVGQENTARIKLKNKLSKRLLPFKIIEGNISEDEKIYNNGVGNDAFMTFHAGGDFAFYFGLDAGTNKLSVGGWSMGAASYAIYHEGNNPSFSQLGITASSINALGINATTLDGGGESEKDEINAANVSKELNDKVSPSNKSVFKPTSVESTVSASKVGKTIGGALSPSKPKVRLLPPGLKPFEKVRYAIVASPSSYSPVILLVTSSVVPSSWN